MKKISLLLSVCLVAFTSCETDFDVNAEWEETMVVFGLLDKSQDVQFIKINKAFLGQADAYEMANVSDSFNYNPEDIIVCLHALDYSDTIWTKNLKDTIIEKDEGLFANDNNIIYYLDTVLSAAAKTYALTVENIRTGNIVSSTTELIDGFSFTSGLSSSKITFYVDDYRSRSLEWGSDYPNVAIFQCALRFHYTEDGVEKNILWIQPTTTENQLTLAGEDFFNKFLMQLEETDAVREFGDIYIEMTLGTKDLKTYMSVNEPISSIVQQRPPFTNIRNGIGLFSSRYLFKSDAKQLNLQTKQYIVEELDLNFIIPL